MTAAGSINALTFDVEDAHAILMRDWFGQGHPCSDAVVRCTERILEMLAERAMQATFFVLGEVARQFPQLVQRIGQAGHEIGLHGDCHRQVFKLTPAEFAREISAGRKAVEDAAGCAVRGHRAPAFSITPETAWALEVLAEHGLEYDSSVFPFRGRRYGWPGFRQGIHRVSLPGGCSIVEAPLSVVRWLGRDLPACGGGYLRHFPYCYTAWAMKRIGRQRPAIVYLHPYELDTAAMPEAFNRPLAAAPTGLRMRWWMQRRNRSTLADKLERLLAHFHFAPLGRIIDDMLPATAKPPATDCRAGAFIGAQLGPNMCR